MLVAWWDHGLDLTSDTERSLMTMDFTTFITYLIAVSLLTITPGVDTLLVIRNTARSGWRDGMVSSLGICSGLFLHAFVSVIGISVILLQAAWAFTALKIIGSGYLVWLGISSWRKALRKESFAVLEGSSRGDSFIFQRSLREGFLSNALNPKTAMFYMAFLPQFIDPNQSAFLQSMFLAGLHFVIAMIWQCFLALMVKQARNWLQRPKISQLFNGVTGTVMIGLGLRVASES